jgi:hypothetical protein
MTRHLVRELYEGMAFKPTPSLDELAQAHVPFGEIGIAPAPEPVIANALREAEGMALLVGETGAGKSSVLAWTATSLAAQQTPTDPPRAYFPVFVPVAGSPADTADLDAFGRATMHEVLSALKGGFSGRDRKRVEEAMASEVSTHHVGADFNVKLHAKVFGTGVEVAAATARDVVGLVRDGRLDNYGGIPTLGTILRARGLELILIVEDTDAWAISAESLDLARSFFRGVARPLATDVDVGVALAVQTPWLSGDRELAEVQLLAEKALTCTPMPQPASEQEAELILERVLDKRIRRGLDEPEALGDAPSRAVFSAEALAELAREFFERGVPRAVLTYVRDTLDRHSGDLPERIELHHLLASV